MNKLLIFGIMMLMLVSMVSAVKPADPVVFGDGLTIDINNVDFHVIDTPLYFYGYIYDSGSGLLVENATCEIDLHYGAAKTEIFDLETNFSSPVTMNASLFNVTGVYQTDVYCEEGLRGGFTTITFDVVPETRFGLWTPVEDWTFPIVYLVITFLIIMFAIAYEASIVGVLGSLMLIFSYFIVGATSPILFTPLLIIGFLLAFKFGTS